MPDNPLFRHFWLLVLVVMLVNVALWRRRLEELVAAGRAARDEVARFLRGAVIAAVVIPLVLEAVALAAGWPNALCFYSEPWTAPAALVMWSLTAATWALKCRRWGHHRVAAPELPLAAARSRSQRPRRVPIVIARS